MTSTLTLNRVNLAAVAGLASAINTHPDKAHTTWAAEVEWTGAFASHAHVRDFAPIVSDEPKTLGGADTAPNPVEQLLAALGNCLAVGYAANATAAGIAIDRLTIAVEGDIDLRVFLGLAEGHAGFSAIRTRVDLQTNATDQEVAALHTKVASTSPVGHTLSSSVPLSIEPAS